MKLGDRDRHPKPSLLAATFVVAALTAVQSHAESDGDQWQWGAAIYLWLPSVAGETSFPPDGGGPSIDISTENILNNLEFVFMGAVEARKGPWAIATDVIYLDFGNSKQATRDLRVGGIGLPASVTADVSLDTKGWLWTLVGSHEALRQENFTVDVLAGARLLDLEEDAQWSFAGNISSLPLRARTGAGEAKSTQLDAIVGLKGRATFGAEGSWYIPYYVDVGAGDSDLTWQAMTGLGYSFGSIDVAGVWRYLDYDLDEPLESISFNGPALAVSFRF
jgi:hypothetical protein